MTKLESKFAAKYNDYLADFKTMSADTEHPNKAPLCSDTHHKYYNFDAIVQATYSNNQPASVDTIVIKNNTIYCVEFKNLTKIKVNKYKENIKQKLIGSEQALTKIFKNLDENCQNFKFIFCVVFKSHPNRYDYAGSIENKGIYFDLAQFKGKYYNDIITQGVDFFRRQFIKKIDQNLPC